MSKKTNTIIEINGQRYNAITGALISGGHLKPKSVDGVVQAPANAPAAEWGTPPAAKPLMPIVHKPVMDITRAVPRHLKHHAPQTSQTLMRRSVQKPIALHPHFKAQTPADKLSKAPKAEVVPKISHLSVDPRRQKRAGRTPKHGLVSRFNEASFTGSSKQVLTLSKPVAQVALESQVANLAVSPRRAPTGSQTSLDIFQKALAEATAHQQRYTTPRASGRYKSRPAIRAARGIGAAVVVALVLGSLTYQNLPNLKLKLARAHIGFEARMPDYRPAGFAVGKVSYDAGNVAIDYHSNSDSRAYTVSEKLSNWDSQTLRDSYVVPAAGQSYQTVQVGGRTIYLFGTAATWVNSGVWYELRNQGNLTGKQLVDIAASL